MLSFCQQPLMCESLAENKAGELADLAQGKASFKEQLCQEFY